MATMRNLQRSIFMKYFLKAGDVTLGIRFHYRKKLFYIGGKKRFLPFISHLIRRYFKTPVRYMTITDHNKNKVKYVGSMGLEWFVAGIEKIKDNPDYVLIETRKLGRIW
jgi:hypothetical protein